MTKAAGVLVAMIARALAALVGEGLHGSFFSPFSWWREFLIEKIPFEVRAGAQQSAVVELVSRLRKTTKASAAQEK